MEPIVLPPPDEIRQRIEYCTKELKALRRMLRTSIDAHEAAAAREGRRGDIRLALVKGKGRVDYP